MTIRIRSSIVLSRQRSRRGAQFSTARAGAGEGKSTCSCCAHSARLRASPFFKRCPTPMLAPQVNIALRAARQAGQFIRRAAEDVQHIKVEQKGRNDFVSEVDRAAEARIIEVLQKAYPAYGILAEESGEIRGKGEDARWQWIIDPLDGTTNF